MANPDLGSPKSTFESASPAVKLPAVSPGSMKVRGCDDDDPQVQVANLQDGGDNYS